MENDFTRQGLIPHPEGQVFLEQSDDRSRWRVTTSFDSFTSHVMSLREAAAYAVRMYFAPEPSKLVTLEDVVADACERLGRDGLVNMQLQCGCKLDDLAPCGEPSLDCDLAFEGPCLPDNCEAGGCDFHMYSTREALERAKARLAELEE